MQRGSSSSVEVGSVDSVASRLSRLKSNEKTNGVTNGSSAGCSNGKRVASKSIPIARKNVEQKKKKNKTIQDCIDTDGLTKIEDKACRKIVERDDQYRVSELTFTLKFLLKTFF